MVAPTAFDTHETARDTTRLMRQAYLPSKADGISHPEYDTMNIFYIIGVVVVVILIAGFLGLR
jgi:hypothetical protein